MPQTITHACFGEDLYNKLPNSIKKKIAYQKKELMMFSQSTDALMFYNVYSIMPGKKYRKIQLTFHKNNTNLFFSTLINYMKDNKYYNDSKTLVFLYGLICHFCLDSIAHPYIIYRTGMFNKKDKSTYKYKGMHSYMESYIDNYYLKQKDIEKFNLKKFCFSKDKFTKELNDSINYSFKNTYNINNMDKVYYKSLNQMNNFLTLFRLDKYGIKKGVYKFIDLITPKSTFPFKSLSYHIDNYDNLDFLNLEKREWVYPVDNNIKSNKNFFELYNDALEEAYHIIQEVNSYFFNNKKIDINYLFKNKSYVTGVDCNLNKKQQFFEF